MPDLYICDPAAKQCKAANASQPGAIPKKDCEQHCVDVPGTPEALKNKYFRGLEVSKGYIEGEWRAKFDDQSVAVSSPNGKVLKGAVSTIGQYMTLKFEIGKVQTLWQIAFDAVTQDLSWAWGAPDGEAPKSFDDAMAGGDLSEYVFYACLPGKDASCDFSR